MSLPALNSHDEFSKQVASGEPFMVKFTAEWCGGCKAIAPAVEQAAKEVAGVKVFEIDVDANQETPAQFGIMSIPAMIFFKGGREVARLGPAKKDQIVGALQELTA